MIKELKPVNERCIGKKISVNLDESGNPHRSKWVKRKLYDIEDGVFYYIATGGNLERKYSYYVQRCYDESYGDEDE